MTQWCLNDRSPRTNMTQSAPLAGKIRYLLAPAHSGRKYNSRKGWPWSGALVETKITLFVAGRCYNVVPKQQWSLILNVIGGWWLWTHMGTCFVSHLVDIWCVKLVSARRNDGGIRHFRRAETTSFHRPNRCAPKIEKHSKTIPRLNCV